MAETGANTVNVFMSVADMTRQQFDMEIQKGMDDIAAGRVIPADAVEAEMQGLFGA